MAVTKLLSWVFLTGILQFQGTWSSVGKDMKVDKTCLPTDCSQSIFMGQIIWEPKFKENYACDAAELKYKQDAASPTMWSFAFLATIGTYLREYKDESPRNPSLNFSLMTPYGGPDSLMTKAIQVNFDSPKGFGEDSFYKDNPRCRIFDFSNASRSDYNYPREINYECFVGLSIANVMTYYYRMKLTSLPSHAVTEYSIVVHSEPREDPDNYRIVLAVAAISIRRSVHVVWERPPAVFHITSYSVTLRDRDGVHHTKTTQYGEEKWEFVDLPPGDFTVQVSPKTQNGSSPCGETRSKPVRLLYITDDTSKVPTVRLKTVLAAVSGVVLAVILLMVILYCYNKKCPGSTECETVLIVNHPTDASTVSQLSSCFTQTLAVKVYSAQEQVRNITRTGLPKWFEDKTKNATIIIVCSKEASVTARNNKRCNSSEDNFCKAIRLIEECPSLAGKVNCVCIDRNHSHQHIDLFPQRMNQNIFGLSCDVISSLRKKNKLYLLPDDCIDLGKKLTRGSISEKYKKHDIWGRFNNIAQHQSYPQSPSTHSSQYELTCRGSGDVHQTNRKHIPDVDFFSQDTENIVHQTCFSFEDTTDETELSVVASQDILFEVLRPTSTHFPKPEASKVLKKDSELHSAHQFKKHHNRFNKTPYFRYGYLNTKRDEDFDKSCVTLLSGDICEMDETGDMLDSGFMSTNSKSSRAFSGNQNILQNKESMQLQSRIYEKPILQDMPDFMHSQYSPHQKTALGHNLHRRQMVHNVQHAQPSVHHSVQNKVHSTMQQYPPWEHHRLREQENIKHYGPHTHDKHVSLDSGICEGTSDSMWSQDGNSHRSSDQDCVYGHINSRKLTDVSMGTRLASMHQIHPLSMNQNSLFSKRQISPDHDCINDEDLFGFGAAAPLFCNGHMPSPQHLPLIETGRLIKRDSDSDTDRSGIRSFCAPDSDNASLTQSSDGEYFIHQDESGDSVIVPKQFKHRILMPFAEEEPVIMDSHLGSRHNSAPDDVREEAKCSEHSSHTKFDEPLPASRDDWTDQRPINMDPVQSLAPDTDHPSHLSLNDSVQHKHDHEDSRSPSSRSPYQSPDPQTHLFLGQVHDRGARPKLRTQLKKLP